MFGLIGKMIVAQGKRDEQIAILLEGVANMPGCLSYIVAADTSDANAIWITEVWDSKASHEASLSLPRSVRLELDDRDFENECRTGDLQWRGVRAEHRLRMRHSAGE